MLKTPGSCLIPTKVHANAQGCSFYQASTTQFGWWNEHTVQSWHPTVSRSPRWGLTFSFFCAEGAYLWQRDLHEAGRGGFLTWIRPICGIAARIQGARPELRGLFSTLYEESFSF